MVDLYLKSTQSQRDNSLADRVDRKGNGSLRFTAIALLDDSGESVDRILVGQNAKFVLQYTASNGNHLKNVAFAMTILNAWGQAVTTCWTEYTGDLFEILPSKGEVVCDVHHFPLSPGPYSIRVSAKVQGIVADIVEDSFRFDVLEGDFFGTGKKPKNTGICLILHSWRLSDR
jgi:lipopolysaccharide transport system ATP-binding protein